jgi:hypothetical protein
MRPSNPRKLSLSRTTLRRLTHGPLSRVVGGISGARCKTYSDCSVCVTGTCTADQCDPPPSMSCPTNVACTNLSCDTGCC